MNLESEAIIEAVKAGSERILLKLYENYRDEFISWATRNHKIDSEEAKDIFQESIIALYKNVKSDSSLRIDSKIKTYLFAIGNNQILNLIKRRGIERKHLEDLTSTRYNPIDKHYENEHLIILTKRIYDNIDSTCREILKMYYEFRFDMDTIASRMGYKNANVAKKKKYECLKALQDRIKLSSLAKNVI